MDVTRPNLAPDSAALTDDSNTRKQLATALFQRLNRLFEQDPEINELGLVLNASPSNFNYDEFATPDTTSASTSTSTSTSPTNSASDTLLSQKESDSEGPAFLLRQHKLGVAFWCIPYIFKYARDLFIQSREEFIKCTSSSSPLPPSLITSLLTSTRCLLLINADHYTAWNIRKQLIIQQHLHVHEELKLLALIYTKHPKSGEAWAHRRWVLSKINIFQASQHATSTSSSSTSTSSSSSSTASDSSTSMYSHPLFHTEIGICERTAELYPKNYYAWTHRQWLVQLLTSYHDLQRELTCVTTWTDRHISDHCGFHHRQVILQQMLLTTCHATLVTSPIEHSSLPPHPHPHPNSHPDTCLGCNAFTSELNYIGSLTHRYPGHETLWCHRRFLYVMYMRMLAQHHGWCGMPSTTTCSSFDWLDTLSTTEMEYAAEQAADDELANHAAHARYAQVYRLYVHEMTALLRNHTNNHPTSTSANLPSLTYPPLLSPADRSAWNHHVEEVKRVWPTFRARTETPV